MAEARDRYLPVRKDDILSALAQQRTFADPAGGERFRRLCEMLAAIYHYEYFEMLERLRGDYYYFNPQVAQHIASTTPPTNPTVLVRGQRMASTSGKRIEVLSAYVVSTSVVKSTPESTISVATRPPSSIDNLEMTKSRPSLVAGQ